MHREEETTGSNFKFCAVIQNFLDKIMAFIKGNFMLYKIRALR